MGRETKRPRRTMISSARARNAVASRTESSESSLRCGKRLLTTWIRFPSRLVAGQRSSESRFGHLSTSWNSSGSECMTWMVLIRVRGANDRTMSGWSGQKSIWLNRSAERVGEDWIASRRRCAPARDISICRRNKTCRVELARSLTTSSIACSSSSGPVMCVKSSGTSSATLTAKMGNWIPCALLVRMMSRRVARLRARRNSRGRYLLSETYAIERQMRARHSWWNQRLVSDKRRSSVQGPVGKVGDGSRSSTWAMTVRMTSGGSRSSGKANSVSRAVDGGGVGWLLVRADSEYG